MFIVYDLIFLVFAVLYAPILFLKKKLHPSFGVRFGAFADPGLKRPVWVHAVSVGEMVSVRHLVEELRRELPQTRFVLSTVTTTGNAIARGIAADGDFVTYLPLDFSWIVAGTLRRLSPSLLLIVETEIWPNLIYWASRRRIPIALVNARISDKSFAYYRLVRFLAKPLLDRIGVFCVQTQRDADKLLRLGVAPDKVKVTGNMKFDIRVKDYEELRKDYHDYRLNLGIGTKEKLFIAASTHPGEEEMVLEAFCILKKDHPDLRLIIAPRHPERSGAVSETVAKAGFEPALISVLAKTVPDLNSVHPNRVFILDSVGKLMYFYAISDIVFVGGSLVPRGGHNVLEPASLGKPIVFGPYMSNFRDIARLFLGGNAALAVADRQELTRTIGTLIADNALASALGARARSIMNEHKGATQRNMEFIKNILKAGANVIK